MSHNKIKVSGQTPDKDGNISLNVEQLNDVNITSASNNEVLKYDGTNWINTPSSDLSGGTVLMIGNGTSQSYPTSGSAIATGIDLEFYGLVYNGISATVGSGWVNSVTLPAGSYLCNAVSGITFSTSTGIAQYRWHDGSNYFGTTGNVGYDTDTIGSSCSGYITSGSSITISVKVTSVSSVNALSAQGTRAAEFGYIEIRKVG